MDPFASTRVLGFLALALVVAGNAAGNILLKLGATTSRESALFGLLNWQTLCGIGCFALGILSYAWALKHIELHVAQIAVSLQYVAVIALAAFVLGENVTSNQWIGMALIGIGLFVCAR
jgi:drug/metabolite transporter (DMT)-like permease